MDVFYVATIVGFFALSFGFLALCERLRSDR